MYISSQVADRIKELVQKRQITVAKLLSDVGLNRNTMSNFKTSFPQADNLAVIADYLDCSIDYLLGRTDNPQSHKSASSISVGSVQSNSGAIGVGNTVTNNGIPLDEQTTEMLNTYKKLSPLNKAKLLVYADELDKKG